MVGAIELKTFTFANTSKYLMPLLPKIHFEVSERKILLRLFDLVFLFGSLLLVGEIFDVDYFTIGRAHWNWTPVLALYFLIFATIFELYDLQKAASFQATLKNVLLSVSITVLFYLLTPFLTPVLPEKRVQIIFFFVAMVIGLLVWRYAYITLFAAQRFNKRVLVVGDSFDINLIAGNLHVADPNYRVVGYVNTDENPVNSAEKNMKAVDLDRLQDAVRRYAISEIVVASAAGINLLLYTQLINLLERGFPIREYSQVYEEITHKLPVEQLERDFYKYFPFSRSNKNRFYLFITICFNGIFAIICLLFTALVLPFVLVGNILANRGPLFYTQKRVGLNGQVFRIFKFRTMIKDAEASGVQWSKKGDHRITKFGKILRNSRLDELPQCINILRGEMGLIGPRPERPLFVKSLSKKIPFYETRHTIKPGLTGWAQVRRRYASSENDALEKLQYDLYYIKHRNVFLDLNIILKTFSTVLYYRGQ